MNDKIVILGNGFDLRHFLPTKYNHLITILRVIEDMNFGNEVENDFEDIFGTLFKEKDKLFFEKINEYYETKNIYFETKKLKSIQERIKINSWFQYLKSVEDNKIESWIDFETEIIRVLSVLSNYFELFNNEKLGKIRDKIQLRDKVYFGIYKHSEEIFFKNKFQKNILGFFKLINIQNSNYSLLNDDYLVVIDDEIQYFKEKEFFDLIYISLEEFVSIFNDYLEKIINTFYRNFKSEKKENFIKSNNQFLFDKVYKIFSFNYTNTYHNLYKSDNSNDNLLRNLTRFEKFKGIDFLHGKSIENLDNDLENLKIVLGVNDIDSLLKNHKLFQFTKYFQKLHKNTDYLFLDDIIKNIKKGLTQYKIDFIFWGHSLDISDKDYISDVFYIVDNNSLCRIKILYHNISGKADQLKNLLNIIDKNIIESMMKNKILTFIESTPKNLFEEL